MRSNKKLLTFLLDAKRNTYAAQGGGTVAVNSLLAGAKQLEFRAGDWLYRDIYFGLIHFSGQEVIYRKNTPVWAMTYSGGMIDDPEEGEAARTYAFLQDALKLVSSEHPFRGPQNYVSGKFTYRSNTNGNIERFEGQEEVLSNQIMRYCLNYAGGCVV